MSKLPPKPLNDFTQSGRMTELKSCFDKVVSPDYVSFALNASVPFASKVKQNGRVA